MQRNATIQWKLSFQAMERHEETLVKGCILYGSNYTEYAETWTYWLKHWVVANTSEGRGEMNRWNQLGIFLRSVKFICVRLYSWIQNTPSSSPIQLYGADSGPYKVEICKDQIRLGIPRRMQTEKGAEWTADVGNGTEGRQWESVLASRIKDQQSLKTKALESAHEHSTLVGKIASHMSSG